MLPQDAERSGGAAGGGLKTSTVCFKVASNVPSETGKLLKTISERSEDEGRDLSFTDLRAVRVIPVLHPNTNAQLWGFFTLFAGWLSS